jgi:hypothetical protein
MELWGFVLIGWCVVLTKYVLIVDTILIAGEGERESARASERASE